MNIRVIQSICNVSAIIQYNSSLVEKKNSSIVSLCLGSLQLLGVCTPYSQKNLAISMHAMMQTVGE
jgi:hypothetical protein